MTANKDKQKPRLKNLDDLFNLNNGVNPLESSVPIIETQPNNKRAVISIAIDKLTPFHGHPFRLYEGERLDDMVASVKANGVLVPIIVRMKNSMLEILAGHNRVNAAKLAGLDEVPAIVFENISDDDAMIYVVETNLLQRSFSDMAHTEKAAVIALHHSKMFSQGKRNDILEQIKILENPHEYKENSTCAENPPKLKSRDIVAHEYGLKRETVVYYIRINKLISELKTLLDDSKIGLTSAATISYLKTEEQKLIADCIERNGLSVDVKKADFLRQFSQKGKLNSENIYRILSGEATPKPNRTPTVKIDKAVYSKYFKPNQSVKEIQATVEKALEMYFEKQ